VTCIDQACCVAQFGRLESAEALMAYAEPPANLHIRNAPERLRLRHCQVDYRANGETI
jgi:hypothetical protein